MTARKYHAASGDPCGRCGAPASLHRGPRSESPSQKRRRAERDRARVETPDQKLRRTTRERSRTRERPVIFIDGEGLDTPDGRHLYIYLACVDEHGRTVSEAWNENGLSFEEVMTCLERLPTRAIKGGFMLSYDVTKWIEQLPLVDRYRLMRPELRRAKRCRGCHRSWKPHAEVCKHCGDDRKPLEVTLPIRYDGRTLDFFAGSTTIGSRRGPGKKTYRLTSDGVQVTEDPGKRRTIKIWDFFRFFSCPFVSALDAWQIGFKYEREFIRKMKDRRGEFQHESPEDIRRYCRDECRLGARLIRALITAHEEAEIPLTRFEGVGSTAAALCKKYGVAQYRGRKIGDYPPELGKAIMSAFSGGWFENSGIGIVDEPVEQHDIASAYPYAQTALACAACGSWSRIEGTASEIIEALEASDYGVAHFQVGSVSEAKRKSIAWCPLPCRDPNGSIVYGLNFSGWAWKEQLLPALRFCKRYGIPIELTGEAWVYVTECKHTPFGHVPATYNKRLEWGKDGKGMTLKGALAATYGKTAQTKGSDPPFQDWIFAGVTTASCRGQVLEAIMCTKNPWNVLAVATDAIIVKAKEKVRLPAPRETGTGTIPDAKSGKCKPLGAWERSEIPEGAFLIKPGLYYRLRPKLKDVRARGVGRKEVYRERFMLLRAFRAWNRYDFDHKTPLAGRRFWGAKHSIYMHSRCTECRMSWPGAPEKRCPICNKIGNESDCMALKHPKDETRDLYGTWGVRVTDIRFDPAPKRERRLSRSGSYSRMFVRDLGGIESKPYDGNTTPEGAASRLAQEIAEEQPDGEDDEE